MNNNKQLNKGDKMNGRAIIIAVLILFKVIGIASRAKAEDIYDYTNWCGWGKTYYDYYDKNQYLEQQIK